MKIPREHLEKLRNALVGKCVFLYRWCCKPKITNSDELGRDKDVTKDVSAFMTYKRCGKRWPIALVSNSHSVILLDWQEWARLLCVVYKQS